MIDTIKIYLHPDLISSYFKTIGINKIKNKKRIINENSEVYESGKYKNLHVSYSFKGLYIDGSLAKFMYGTNQMTLNEDSFIKVIDKISTELGLPLTEGKVIRVDIGENIITKEPENHYYKVMGEAVHFTRIKCSNGLEYRSSNRCVSVYNKIRELKIKQEPVIPVFTDRNVLRYEYRLLNHETIAKFLKKEQVTAADIVQNYQKFITEWEKIFGTIYKNNDLLTFSSNVFKEKKGFEKQITILGVKSMGGLQTVIDTIKEARKDKFFPYSNSATNLIARFKELMQSPILTEKSTLATELTGKIRLIGFLSSNANADFMATDLLSDITKS